MYCNEYTYMIHLLNIHDLIFRFSTFAFQLLMNSFVCRKFMIVQLRIKKRMLLCHQKILYKKLITATCVKNHFRKTHKLEFLKIQKLILKKIIIINDIVKEILNVKCFAIHLILIIYCFVSIFNCSDIF